MGYSFSELVKQKCQKTAGLSFLNVRVCRLHLLLNDEFEDATCN